MPTHKIETTPCYLYSIFSFKHQQFVYIGQTIDPKSRWEDYCANNKKRVNRHLSKSIQKYGIDNFVFRVEEKFSTVQEAKIAEIEAIACVKLCGYKLYNLTDGGEGTLGFKHTPESLAKISGSNSVHFGKISPLRGRKHNTNQIEAKRQRLLGVPSLKRGKKYGENLRNKACKCIRCEQDFLAKVSTAKFCSRKCRYDRKIKQCLFCFKLIVTRRKMYCSDACKKGKQALDHPKKQYVKGTRKQSKEWIEKRMLSRKKNQKKIIRSRISIEKQKATTNAKRIRGELKQTPEFIKKRIDARVAAVKLKKQLQQEKLNECTNN